MVAVAHFIFRCFHAPPPSTERVSKEDICDAILVAVPRLPTEDRKRSSPDFFAVIVYREQIISDSNGISNSSRSQFWLQ